MSQKFLSDCASLLTPLIDTDGLLKHEVDLAIAFLDEAHQEIIEHFAPKVIKLRKNEKNIMVHGFLDDLERISSEISDDDDA